MKDVAESHLEGDVSPGVAGGVIRYRLWPAKRRPFRAGLAAICVVGLTWLTWWAYASALWAALVFVGLTMAVALFLFPTEVALDGCTLHIKQLGSPRTWDLRQFRRIEVTTGVLPRVELGTRPRLSPMDSVKGVTVPLPDEEIMSREVLVHLRRWVGRTATGRFEIDSDHVPEDTVS